MWVIIDDQAFSYGEGSLGSKRVRKAMADHINRHFHPQIPVSLEHVLFSAGVTSVNEIVAWNLADAGDGILLNMPIYGPFEIDFTAKADVKLIYVPMEGVDPLSEGAIGMYEAALRQAETHGTRVRALLICNPHNPLGRCYSQEALKAHMKFCQKHNIHLVSDEIYALTVFDSTSPGGIPFTSVLSFDTAGLIDQNYLHVTYGMSKDFGAAGLRLGCLISRNAEMLRAFNAISRFGWPSQLACVTSATILEAQEWCSSFLEATRQRLRENHDLAIKVLDEAGIKYHTGRSVRPLPSLKPIFLISISNAGYFLWVDLSPYLPSATDEASTQEQALAGQFVNAGVYLGTGAEYHSEEAGWFRIVYTHKKEELLEGLKRAIGTAKKNVEHND